MNPNLEVPSNLDILLDVPVTLTVELGSCQLPMREVLQLAAGSIVQLDKPAGTPVELRANHKLVARGEVVVVEDHLGIRITELATSGSQSTAVPATAAPEAVGTK
jgi:flagellar motor switch protein FliN/FliY